jgi:hypothetical protein
VSRRGWRVARNTEDGHTVGIRDEDFEALIEQLK